MPVEVKLSDIELDNALWYLEEEGQSLYLPDQFEINALRAAWDNVKPILMNVNLLSYVPKPCVQLIAPKQKFTVRPILLLDPVDLVLLTGLGLRFAPLIDKRRKVLGPNVVHSWQYSTTTDGKPQLSSNWDAWVAEVVKRKDKYPFVAKADIVDFFPRIYLHRLENALSSVTKLEQETKAIMRLLEAWSHGTSYGIPIGPRICGILAEALLSEVDELLQSYGFDFVRYIDDYIFFAKTPSHCLKALFVLAERLQTTQGLSLNMAKTKVQPMDKLIEELTDPSEKSAGFRHQVIEDVFGGNPYEEVEYDNLSEEQKDLLDSFDLKVMLEEALEPDIVDLPMVKFVLNVLASLHRPELAQMVLDNLERLLPAAPAVARFLSMFATEDDSIREHIARCVFDYLSQTSFVPDYYSLWLLELFARDPRWNHLAELRVIAREHRNRLVRRQAIMALGNIGDRSALLDVKSSIDDVKDWEWRGIVYACRTLPSDERNAFWRSLQPRSDWNLGTIMPRVTYEYAKSQHCNGR